MSSGLIRRLFAVTSFRLSVAYAVLLALSFGIAAGGAWLTTRSAALDEAHRRLSPALLDLNREVTGQEDATIIAAIEERMSRHDALLWRLSTPDGRTVAGDHRLLSNAIGIEVYDPGGGDLAVLTQSLPDGRRLSVAEDIERTERIRDAVLLSLTMVGLLASVLAIGAGVWITRRSLARMTELGEALRLFGAGDLSVRAPARNTRNPDDVDDLIERINHMLGQTNMLVANVRRVSADVAHDLRTPLTHLRQRLELMRGAADGHDRQAIVEAAQSSIDQILRTFDAMLRLSALETNAARGRFAMVDLSEIAGAVCDAYRPDIEASGRFLSTFAEGEARIWGDRDSLAQAISNLLENAMRHTPAGAAIEVRLKAAPRRVCLSVSDTGPGIPSDSRVAVLEPFRRLDESRSQPGSGLGLSIVAAVARQHDASIALQDNDPGLLVTLSFPANESRDDDVFRDARTQR